MNEILEAAFHYAEDFHRLGFLNEHSVTYTIGEKKYTVSIKRVRGKVRE